MLTDLDAQPRTADRQTPQQRQRFLLARLKQKRGEDLASLLCYVQGRAYELAIAAARQADAEPTKGRRVRQLLAGLAAMGAEIAACRAVIEEQTGGED